MLGPNKAAEYGLATTGAIINTLPVVPQIIKSYQTKSTNGLSPHLMSIWGICCLFIGAYNVSEGLAIPLQIQPHAYGVLCAISWAQCLCYGSGVKATRAATYCAVVLGLAGAFELPSIFALKYAQLQGTQVPMDMFAYFSTLLTFLGLVPQYYEIWRLREVRGISLSFMGLSILGCTITILSLFFRMELPIPSFISYLVYGVLDAIIIILALVLNPIAKKKRAEAAPLSPESALQLTVLPRPVFDPHSMPPTPASEMVNFAPMQERNWENEVEGVNTVPPTPAEEWGPMDADIGLEGEESEATTSATEYFDTPSTLQRRSSFASPAPTFGMTAMSVMAPKTALVAAAGSPDVKDTAQDGPSSNVMT